MDEQDVTQIILQRPRSSSSYSEREAAASGPYNKHWRATGSPHGLTTRKQCCSSCEAGAISPALSREMDNTLVLKGDDDYEELYGCDDLGF
jgi:hypothetical protein